MPSSVFGFLAGVFLGSVRVTVSSATTSDSGFAGFAFAFFAGFGCGFGAGTTAADAGGTRELGWAGDRLCCEPLELPLSFVKPAGEEGEVSVVVVGEDSGDLRIAPIIAITTTSAAAAAPIFHRPLLFTIILRVRC